uniref:Cadherin-12 n=1 Tax=Echeneis naucrates TaxID=173247 RepID=A0A665X2H8_ECHNA
MLTRNCLLLFLWIVVDAGSVSSLRPSLVAPIRNGAAGFQRVKRGWVWNQFFVLEEYMGSDPQYVGKLHTDLDKGDSAVKYTLSGEGAGSIFTIDQTTGDIHALRSLDREEKPYYTLRAQAVDINTNRPLEPESEFVIKVQDINDNEPKFLEGPYMASVPEMSPVGTYVTQVTATDADDPTYGNSARVVYSILHGQPYFSVDPKTGVIKTALPNMDREVKEQYQVLIQAKDMGGQLGGLAGTTTVNITLSDVNDNPPRFSKSEILEKSNNAVPESSAVGSAVGRIKAHDLDIGRNAEVEYTIVPGDGGAMFDITTNEHNQEGIIILKRPLDYETKKAYTFKVDASNAHLDPRFQNFGAFKDTATVKINVLDVDEPPVFNKPAYVMDVYEDTPAGTIIGAVTAQDLDASSSPVRYSIDWKSDMDSFFDIDPVEGTISTNELLDRESIAQHNISVVATKLNSPVLTSRVAVTVHVLDINEFPPELASPYETFVCENAKMGQVIQTFSAKDQDLPMSGQQFSFKSPREDVKVNKNFTIRDFGNNTAGIVTKRGGFRRRLQEIYFLPVVIEDNGYPPKSSTGTLTIRVCGCESDGSLLTCSAEAIFLPVGLSTGALVAILLCIIILLVIVVLYVGLRRQKKKETLMSSKEDIRDNVIHYDDEGGGEEDTHAFDMGTLRNPKVVKENLYRRDVKPEMKRDPRPLASQDSADIRDFINQRLKEHDVDNSAPPYDSLATYAYEGDGSVAESLSSIGSLAVDLEEDYDYLKDWGPRFKTLYCAATGPGVDRDQCQLCGDNEVA